jgi:hypothetical protein
MSESIKLGDRVRDRITGLVGIAIGVTDWLYGCRRWCVQPEKTKDGKPAETCYIDEPQLEVVDRGAVSPQSEPRRHGPRNDPGRKADPGRNLGRAEA